MLLPCVHWGKRSLSVATSRLLLRHISLLDRCDILKVQLNSSGVLCILNSKVLIIFVLL